MADESDDIRADAGDNSLAAQIALNEGSGHSAEAREYLRKQSRIADLTIDTLQKKDEFELSHLRFRRFSDWAKFALEISAGLVVLLLVCGLATMVWSASRDRDLVVDAFSVPPDVAATGLTGSVLAGRVLDSFGHMQDAIFATTQGAGSYRADAQDSVRVEIPDTGVSIGELNRYLRLWLGHETHVGGDLVHVPGGGLALTTRFGTQAGSTVQGKSGELDKLVKKSAEHIFAAALPYRYVEYLVRERRFAEARALAPRLAAQGTSRERALANSAWAKVYFFEGDMPHALEKGREAVALDPDNPITHAWLSVAEANLGHDEASRANSEAALREWRNGAPTPATLEAAPILFTSYRDEMTGDFADSNSAWVRFFAAAAGHTDNNERQSAVSDAASAHDLRTARRIAAEMTEKDSLGRPDAQTPWGRMNIAYSAEDWAEAVKQARAVDAILRTQPDVKWNEFVMLPEWAYATARTGDIRTAKALIAKTIHDCDDCLLQRGRIAALEHHWSEAAQDFAIVAARSPHIPFADTDWGEMLLRKGDLDGAIAKFALANQKGPHFADPLEMWGEALIARTRSDLALAKFEEASKYAPNWGRLHLRWGEALWWSGDKSAAQKQFALARTLDLTAPEESELARMGAAHG